MTAFTRGNANFHGYVLENYYDPDQDGTLNGKTLGAAASNYGGMVIMTTKYNYPAPTKIMSAPDALNTVLAIAGASKSRDSVDARLVAQVKTWGKSGALISDPSSVGGVGTIAGGTAPTDSNKNGIPDSLESQFSNVEDYANSLVPSSY